MGRRCKLELNLQNHAMKTSPTTRREAFTTAGLAVLGASLAPSTLAADAADDRHDRHDRWDDRRGGRFDYYDHR